MSKSSTVTSRETPVQEVVSAKAGGLIIHGETFVVQTDQRIELVDLTLRVMEFVRRFNIREGLVSLWSMHTTCALFINEFQTALLADILRDRRYDLVKLFGNGTTFATVANSILAKETELLRSSQRRGTRRQRRARQ